MLLVQLVLGQETQEKKKVEAAEEPLVRWEVEPESGQVLVVELVVLHSLVLQ